MYKKTTFVGHDWSANVVWHLALLHPERVYKVINLVLPYQNRGDKPWLEVMEAFFGEDIYFVHFKNQPGVADAVLEKHTANFFQYLFRKNVPLLLPEPGMLLMKLEKAEHPIGEPIMSDAELKFFIESFKTSRFTFANNWYRNLDSNWHAMAYVKPRIQHPTLMIYGEKDVIPKSQTLKDFAPNLDVVSLVCGHLIQQE
jgi:pimeloyl-ACP methyl ester carboxylesterase